MGSASLGVKRAEICRRHKELCEGPSVILNSWFVRKSEKWLIVPAWPGRIGEGPGTDTYLDGFSVYQDLVDVLVWNHYATY